MKSSHQPRNDTRARGAEGCLVLYMSCVILSFLNVSLRGHFDEKPHVLQGDAPSEELQESGMNTKDHTEHSGIPFCDQEV